MRWYEYVIDIDDDGQKGWIFNVDCGLVSQDLLSRCSQRWPTR